MENGRFGALLWSLLRGNVWSS